MAGTKAGGQKAREANLRKYGPDFYVKIGAIGGKLGRTGGFWHAKHILGDTEKVREAGRKGGSVSYRTSGREKKQ